MIDLYDIQPASCRAPLPVKDFTDCEWYAWYKENCPHIFRLWAYDPAPVFERIANSDLKADPFKRVNKLTLDVMYPKMDGLCGCGCGVTLPDDNRRRWASKDCEKFAVAVWAIIANWQDRIKKYVLRYHSKDWRTACVLCGDLGGGINIDHIVPIHAGGGLCWLSNLQPICVDCHKEKTKQDYKMIVQRQPALFG